MLYNFLMVVSYDFSYQGRAFVPDKPFQPSLMFVDKDRSLPKSGAPERCLTRVGLLRKVVTYGCKKFYNIGPRENRFVIKRLKGEVIMPNFKYSKLYIINDFSLTNIVQTWTALNGWKYNLNNIAKPVVS